MPNTKKNKTNNTKQIIQYNNTLMVLVKVLMQRITNIVMHLLLSYCVIPPPMRSCFCRRLSVC